MSANELLPLFPSQLHPALPISVQLLSTLRSLTAPGRGNDLRPEERTALVGVAALIGCEKVQSKDLSEKSAQKACSVSPAHFRSALAHARRLLKTVDQPSLDPAPSTRRSSRSTNTSPVKPATRSSEGSVDAADDVTPANTGAPSPFSTPKKRFKFSSGVDISSLVRNTPKSAKGIHEPAQSSPLRHSVTPSKRPSSPGPDQGADGAGEGLQTPTKRTRFTPKTGVDLEHVKVAEIGQSSRRKREDPSAFFAMRPGGAPTPGRLDLGGSANKEWNGNIPMDDGLPDVRPRRPKRAADQRKVKERARKDWRYPETAWGSDGEARKTQVDQLLVDLAEWLEKNGRRLQPLQGSVEDLLLADGGDAIEHA